MTHERLLAELMSLKSLACRDPEHAHLEADAALIEYIADPAIKKAWDAIKPKYYS